MSRSTRVICFFALLLSTLYGHDLYLLPDRFQAEPSTKIQVAFHNGDSFPESEVAPKPDRLQDASLRSSNQNRHITGLHISGNETLGMAQVPGRGCILLSVRTVPNFIELPADKFTAYLKEEGLTKVLRWRGEHQEALKPGRERYRKFAKSLLVAGKADDFYKEKLGLAIEIVPLLNPYQLHAGARLPVQVLFRGKPAADLQLEAAWAGEGGKKVEVVGRTKANGQIDVPLAKPGKWRLHTLAMERCPEPKIADWDSYWASLTFAIEP